MDTAKSVLIYLINNKKKTFGISMPKVFFCIKELFDKYAAGRLLSSINIVNHAKDYCSI